MSDDTNISIKDYGSGCSITVREGDVISHEVNIDMSNIDPFESLFDLFCELGYPATYAN